MKLKVTVGVCVRNCEDFIGETIDSIVSQDFPHELMELIFVDDGSQDKTFSIIEGYASKIDVQVRIFRQEWKGLGSARNIVVNNARGKYIIWVDGDMLLSVDFISKQVQFMQQNPVVGIAKAQYSLTPGPNLLATLEIFSRAASKMVDFNYKNKAHAKSLGTGGCIYRVKAIRSAGGFDEDIKGYGEDLDAECRIRAAGWLLATTSAQFRDYERRGITSKQLWARYRKRGYDLRHFLKKNRGTMNLYTMLPFVAILAGLVDSYKIYQVTRRKVVFLLPLQYVLKNTAWLLGFMKNGTSLPSKI